MYSNTLDLVVMNASSIVDIFFVVGGCVLSWTVLGCLQRDKGAATLQVYLYRYLR